MLPKRNRLSLANKRENLRKDGKRFGDELFNMVILTNATEDRTRFAVVVGKKVSKNAVVRNRVRRRSIEMIHGLLKQLKKGYDVQLYVKKAAIEATTEELNGSVFSLLEKGGMLEER